uniref:Uncharacterized protein n=1 Tax=Anguilla anguilla TaxID=7936 RepID=A0A0E9TET7_ANGAN
MRHRAQFSNASLNKITK